MTRGAGGVGVEMRSVLRKLRQSLRPSQETWERLINDHGEDGTTLLTFAVASGVATDTVERLLEMTPCLDPTVRDCHFHMSALELAASKGRCDLVTVMRATRSGRA
jgi:hypothetical protein